MPAVRVPGGDDGAAVQIRDQPGLGGDVAGHRGSVGGGDDAATAQRIAADRRGGNASGSGGSPASGTSDESTAGGVLIWYGQFAGAGIGLGAGLGVPDAAPASASAPDPAIAKTAAARHDAAREQVRVKGIAEQTR